MRSESVTSALLAHLPNRVAFCMNLPVFSVSSVLDPRALLSLAEAAWLGRLACWCCPSGSWSVIHGFGSFLTVQSPKESLSWYQAQNLPIGAFKTTIGQLSSRCFYWRLLVWLSLAFAQARGFSSSISSPDWSAHRSPIWTLRTGDLAEALWLGYFMVKQASYCLMAQVELYPSGPLFVALSLHSRGER